MTEDKRRPGRPRREGGPDPVRSFRMGSIYDQAEARAEEREEKLPHVIERKLAEYAANDPARELYDASMVAFLEVHARRESWESATGQQATPATLPREILVPWRQTLSQVRLLRAQYRLRGFRPPAVPDAMPWLDERVMEPKDLGDDNFAWFQTDAPKESRFA